MVESGYCQCGCGGRPKLERSRYLPGHHAQGRRRDPERVTRGQEAQRLIFQEGLSYPAVAERLGVTVDVVYHYMADPDGSKARERSLRHATRRRQEDPETWRRDNRERNKRYRQRLARRQEERPLDHTTAKGADGPKLYAWLEGQQLLTYELRKRHDRFLYRLRTGGVCGIDALDRMLTLVGVHMSELPDDLWLPYSKSRPGEGGR